MKTSLVLALGASCAFSLVDSTGADDSGQTLADRYGQATNSQALDSYWLDQNDWLQYGYRPHVQSQGMHLGGYYTGGSSLSGYSYGITPDPLPSLGNPLDKTTVQLTKYGTWH